MQSNVSHKFNHITTLIYFRKRCLPCSSQFRFLAIYTETWHLHTQKWNWNERKSVCERERGGERENVKEKTFQYQKIFIRLVVLNWKSSMIDHYNDSFEFSLFHRPLITSHKTYPTHNKTNRLRGGSICGAKIEQNV